MWDEIPTLTSFMKQTKSRLRTCPPEIELLEIGRFDLEEVEQVMDQVQLRRFDSIKSLTYRVLESNHLGDLAHSSLHFSPASVDHVAVLTQYESDFPLERDCDRDLILNQSPDITFLELEVQDTIIFGSDQVYSALLKLSIRKSSAPSLLLQVSKFPGIQELRITGQKFTMDPLFEDVILPQLQLLCILDVVGIAWSKISAPRLCKVTSNDKHTNRRFFPFCFRHTSIVELTYSIWVKEDQLKALVTSMSNLEYLDISGELRGMYLNVVPDIPFPPFPNLKTLTVDDTVEHRLSLVEFENFVLTRLLPQHSQDTPTLKMWRILVNSKK